MYVMTRNVGLVAMVGLDEEKGIANGQVEANARLIAAAPEMAEMLRELYGHLVANAAGEYLDISDHYIRIGDLLAKAGVKLS